MTRRRGLSVAWRALFLLCLPALAGGAEDRPLSVRRVQIDAAGLAQVLQKEQELVPVARREFEQALRQAQDRLRPDATRPRLQSARYEAQWHDGQLLGTAALTLRQADHGPRVFALEPWRFAVRGPARLGGRPALLGEIDGKTFGVIVEKPGIQSLTFGWSAPLQRRPEGWWFFFQAPLAPIVELALDLPTSFIVELPGARQLTPVAESISPEVRRWRIPLDDSRPAALEVWIRPAPVATRTAFFVTRQAIEHDIGPVVLETRAEIDLEITQGRPADVILETDDRLEVVSAALRTAGQPPIPFRIEAGDGRNRITLLLPQAVGKHVALEVRARAASPVGIASRWRLPWLRVSGAMGAREILGVRARSDVVLSDWEFGDYRPVLPPAIERRGGAASEVFTLEQRNLGSPGLARSPSLRVRLQGPDFSVRQEAWWHVATESSSFVTRSTWQVQAGKLPSLVVLAPQGWELESLELSPTGMLLDHYLDRRAPGRILVQLKGVVDVSTSVQLTARFRRSGPPLDLRQPAALVTPHLVAEGARWQQTTLAVSLERGGTLRQPLLHGSLPGGAGTAFSSSLPFAPWARFVQTPDLVVSYFGREPPTPLAIEPAPARIQSQIRTRLFVSETDWQVRYQIEASPLSGRVVSIPLHLPGNPSEVRWQVVSGQARIREARLSPPGEVGGSSGLELLLDQPVDGVVTIHGDSSLPPGPSVSVPLISFGHDQEATGSLVIQVEPGQHVRLQSEGSRPRGEVASATPDPEWPIWQSFHYGRETQSVQVHRVASAQETPPIVASAHLVVRCQPPGPQRCTYECIVLNPRLSPLRLQLPVGAEFRALWLDGRRMPVPCVQEGTVVLPAANAAARYRLDYAIPAQAKAGISMAGLAAPQWESSVILLASRRFLAAPDAWTPLGWPRLERMAGALPPGSWLFAAPNSQDLESLGRSLHGAESSAVVASSRTSLLDSARNSAASPFHDLADSLLQLQAQSPEPRVQYVLDAVALATSPGPRRKPPTDSHVEHDTLEELVYVPCRGALLVTTASQLRAENVTSTVGAELLYGPDVVAALAHGQDPSGRFQRLIPGMAQVAMEQFDDWDVRMGWTIYEVPSGEAASEIALIRRDIPWLLGGLVGLIVLGGAWWVRRRLALRGVVLLIISVGAVLLLIWLPAPLKGAAAGPLAAAALAWVLSRRPTTGSILSSTSSHQRLVAPAALLLVIAGLLFAHGRRLQAQSADSPTTVYYHTDSTGTEQVYVPRALWRRLLDLNSDRLGPRYVLLDAVYAGRIDSAQGEFEVEYRLHALADDAIEIELPIRNARLRQALLDQRPTLVEPLPQENGFRVHVVGRGVHVLHLSWTSTVEARGEVQELRCTVPPVTASQLQLHFAGRSWEAIDVRGAKTWKKQADSVELAADLGRTSELSLRSTPDGENRPALRVQGFHRWQLSLSAWRLQSRFDYQVSLGRVSGLRVLLPPALDVQDVEFRVPAREDPVRLREWQVEVQGDRRFLRVVFEKPMIGGFDLRLGCRVNPVLTSISPELSPLTAILDCPGCVGLGMVSALMEADVECLTQGARTARLIAPTPLDAEQVSGFVAVSLNDVAVVEPITARGLTAVAAEAELGRLPAEFLGDDKPAGLFHFAGPAAPSLLLHLRPTSPHFHVEQSLAILVDGGAVELRGRIEVRATEGELTLLQIQLSPRLTLLSLQGDDVHRWTVQGNTLQVWLRRSITDGTVLMLRGWLHAASDRDGSQRLTLPRLQYIRAASVSTQFELHSRSVVRFEALGSQGLRALTGPFADASQVGAWLATSPSYRGELLVSSSPASATPSPTPPTPSRRSESLVQTSLRDEEHLVSLAPGARLSGLTRYVLTYGPGGEFGIHVPEGIRPLVLTIDGQLTEYSWASPQPIVVTLPAPRVWCEVALLWTEVEAGAAARDSNIGLPRADAARKCRGRLCLLSPAGVASPDLALAGGPEDAAALELEAAEQWLRLLHSMAPDAAGPAATATDSPRQRALERIARRLLAAEASLERGSPQTTAPLSARLAKLRRDGERLAGQRVGELLARRNPKGESVAELPLVAAFARRGVPAYGLFEEPPETLEIEMTDPARVELERKLFASLAALGLGAATWSLRRSSRAQRLLCRLAPEACAVAGVLWCLLLPGGWIGGLAVFVGVIWRGGRIVRWLILPPAAPTPDGSAAQAHALTGS